jgi:UDP-N-acetylglucosamine acyltransferase
VGTVQDKGRTTIGDDNWIMAYVHVAHDCVVGNNTTLANNTTMAGHVELGDWVTVGGLTGIHQFVKIGAHAMVGFQSAVSQDVPPFVTAAAIRAGARHQCSRACAGATTPPTHLRWSSRCTSCCIARALALADAAAAIDQLRGEQPEAWPTSI